MVRLTSFPTSFAVAAKEIWIPFCAMYVIRPSPVTVLSSTETEVFAEPSQVSSSEPSGATIIAVAAEPPVA